MTLFDLLFIVSLLGTVATLLVATVQLFRGHRAAAARIVAWLGIAVAAYLALVIGVSLVFFLHGAALSRENGTFVYPAKPQFESVARNLVDEDAGMSNATPAFSNGQIFLRTNRYLYCIAKK